MTYIRMADAAYASNIPPGFSIAAGYYGGAGAYHVWPAADWGRFPGFKLPIWVPPTGPKDGLADGSAAVRALHALDVPGDSFTVVDMETMQDATYVSAFAAALADGGGWRTWVYGSVSTVFSNPPCNGYWVADYTTNVVLVDQLLQQPHVRAVQCSPNQPPGYDVSLVKQWTEGGMWQ